MNETPPKLGAPAPQRKKPRGFIDPAMVRAGTFYTIVVCILAGVIACILAIWDFAEQDVFWRLIATFVVVAGGAAMFAFVNNIFGEEPRE